MPEERAEGANSARVGPEAPFHPAFATLDRWPGAIVPAIVVSEEWKCLHRSRAVSSCRALSPSPPCTSPRRGPSLRRIDLNARLAEIEAAAQGRLGVAILDTKTGDMFGRRELERFPLCSTFKVLAAALVLQRVDLGAEQLDRRVVFSAADVVENSPVTQGRAGPEGMTIAEICAAAITVSDNTAGNLMLASFGGPGQAHGFSAHPWRQGDAPRPHGARAQRGAPGDPRDGTTPRAMAYTLQRILLGNVLSKSSEALLIGWLTASTTGEARLRAGLPAQMARRRQDGHGCTRGDERRCHRLAAGSSARHHRRLSGGHDLTARCAQRCDRRRRPRRRGAVLTATPWAPSANAAAHRRTKLARGPCRRPAACAVADPLP